MTFTSEERREVAQKLRELPSDVYEVESQWKTEGISTDCHDQTDYYLIHDVLLECLPAEHMHPCDYEELHARLAELIEPEPERTCRPVFMNWAGNPPYNESGARLDIGSLALGCSECGCPWGSKSARVPNFCPNCGAKVVG